jgi:hypothetical protein
MFEVASSDQQGSVKFKTWIGADGTTHPVGGWQGGRGWQINASAVNDPDGNYLLAGKWMIENVFEALDVPNEWFFDPKLHKLYLIPNVTVFDGSATPPPTDVKYIAVQLETLISINGTQAAPVTNITVYGARFSDGNLHSRMPLVPTAARLNFVYAYGR